MSKAVASGEKGGDDCSGNLTKGHPCLECDRGGPHTLAMALIMSMFDDLYFLLIQEDFVYAG